MVGGFVSACRCGMEGVGTTAVFPLYDFISTLRRVLDDI